MMTPLPSVSILLPLRNEGRNIAECLTGLLDNDYPLDKIEILVIDGESSDDTIEIVKSFQDRITIKVFSNPLRVPYTGLNIGLQNASGELIMRVDARSMIPKNYISTCVRTLLETGADNVGGVQKQYGTTPIQKAIALATSHPFGVGNAQFRLGNKSGYVDTVYLGCFRKKLFDTLGEFDADGPVISEDSSLNKRIIDNGGKVYLNKDIVIRYPAKDSFSSLLKQYYIYGGAKAHIVLKYRKFTSLRQIIPLFFCFAFLVSLMLAPFHSFFSVVFAALFSAYFSADVAVSIQLALREGDFRVFFPLTLIFPLIHFSWSTGFLVRVLEGRSPGSHWRKA